MQVPGYPEYFENWWMVHARNVFGCANLYDGELRIRQRIQALTDLFTLQRNRISVAPYNDPELAAAYGLFYFPETFVRIQFPLTELMNRGWLPAKKMSILDLGSGAGAAGFGAASVLQNHTQEINLIAIDQSRAAIEISSSIAMDIASFMPQLHWQSLARDISVLTAIPDEQWDLIILSFALNELALHQDYSVLSVYVEKMMKLLKPEGFLLILEPASRESSERLEMLRDDLLAITECCVWAPCLHAKRCPLLIGNQFWCHEVRRWEPPPGLKFLNRSLHRSETVLKYSFIALGRHPIQFDEPDGSFRMISPWLKTKGKWMVSGCATDGQTHEYQILKREIEQDHAHALKKMERGDILKPDFKIHRIKP